MIVVSIDPATHTTGYARFNSETKHIYEAQTIKGYSDEADERIRQISRVIYELVDCKSYPPPAAIFIEVTHFRQNLKTNDMYQKLIGAIVGVIGLYFPIPIKYVQNTTMKKLVGGHGKSDKHEVANGVLAYFDCNPEARLIVTDLIKAEQWDITDALGIGIAGIA